MGGRRHWAVGLVAAGLLTTFGLPAVGRTLPSLRPQAPVPSKAEVAERLASLPVRFEPNAGQSASPARFLARASGLAMALGPTEAQVTIGGGKDEAPALASLRLVGANPDATMAGEARQPGRVNYLAGNDPSRWRSNLPTYGKVVSRGVYRGVDLAWYGAEGGAVEYDFVVAPGADPSPIALSVGGAESVSIDPAGDLVARLGGGATLRQHRPVAYQERHAKRVPVEAAFVLEGDQVRFRLGDYDRSRALVIDPVLAWSTYLGGSLWDLATSVRLDGDGNVYVAGPTLSLDFPVTFGAHKLICGCGALDADAFVAKFSPAGALVYATYVGGSSHDVSGSPDALSVSPAGEAHVTGASGSPDFPLVGSTRVCEAFPGADAFAFKLNASGSALAYSTCLGGEEFDEGMGSAVDSAGNAYVVGYTDSPTFPMLNAEGMGTGGRCLDHEPDPSVPEVRDGFLTKISPTGALVYSTCWGTLGIEHARAVDVDTGGNAYVVGDTDSSSFPQKNHTGVQESRGGQLGLPDAWVLKVTPKPKPAFSTYLGGKLDEFPSSVVVAGNALYVAGGTYSTNFATKWPTATEGAYQRDLNRPLPGKENTDAFVARLVGTGLVPPAPKLDRLTYLGGSLMDFAGDLAVRNGAVWVVGTTESGKDDPATTSRVETPFPTVAPLQPECALDLPEENVYRGDDVSDNANDAFVARFDKRLTTLSFSTCLGGNGRDFGYSLALDAAGNAYVVGKTISANDDPSTPEVETPFPTKAPGASGAFFDPTCGTDGQCNRDSQLRVKDDAFVAKISPG